MNGDSVVANDQPGFRPGVTEAQNNFSNLSISVDNGSSIVTTTNEDTFDTSKFYELMKTPTNESDPTLPWSETSNGKNNVHSVGPTTPTPTPTPTSTSKSSSITGSFLTNVSATKVGRNPNTNLSPWNASVDNSLRLNLNLNLNSNSNSNSNMSIKNMNTEIFLNPPASQLNKRVTRFNSTPALRMSDDIGLLERYNNSTGFQTTPVYSQNYINSTDGSIPWMNQTRSQSQSHLQVQSQRSSTVQPKTSNSLSSSPTLWATNPPLSADDSNSSLRSSRFFPSPLVDSHQKFEDYDSQSSPLVTQSRRTIGTSTGSATTASTASTANTTSNEFGGRSNSVGYPSSSLDFTSFNSMVPTTPQYNTPSSNEYFDNKFNYQPPYSTSAITSFQPQQGTPLQYVHINNIDNSNNAKANASCFVDPLSKTFELTTLMDDVGNDLEEKDYAPYNNCPSYLEPRIQLESRSSSPDSSKYMDISPTLPSASLLNPISIENDEVESFEQFNDPKSMVLHYIHHIVTRHNSLIQSYIASLPINVASDVAHRLINLVFYPIGKVLKCEREEILKNDVFVKYKIIAMVVESAVQNVKERASGPWRSVRFEIPETGRESKMLIFYDDYEHDDSYKDDYGELENCNSNSSNTGGGGKLDVSWYPEGFSSTFHRRGVNNFMFVRELQSKMIINRIRLGGGMISETGEFRVSVPVEELGIDLENINNAADYLEGSNGKLKRSFMVNIDLRELDGKNTNNYANNNRDFRYGKNNANGNNNNNSNMNGNNNSNGNNSIRGGRGGSRGSSRGYHGHGKRGAFRGAFRGHKK